MAAAGENYSSLLADDGALMHTEEKGSDADVDDYRPAVDHPYPDCCYCRLDVYCLATPPAYGDRKSCQCSAPGNG